MSGRRLEAALGSFSADLGGFAQRTADAVASLRRIVEQRPAAGGEVATWRRRCTIPARPPRTHGMHRQSRAQIHLTKPSSQFFMRLIASNDQPTAAMAAPHAIVLIMPVALLRLFCSS